MAFTQRSPDCPFLVSYQGHSISEVKSAWQTARRKANLPQVLIHVLRRTAVRNMIRAGISEKMAMLISGHKTRSMFDRYHIIDERDIVQAGYKLERYLESLDAVGTKVGTEETLEVPLSSKQVQ
jgi:integrase